MLRFTREIIAFRKRHPCLMQPRFLTGMKKEGTDITWHGLHLHQPLWGDPAGQILAFTLTELSPGEGHLHIMLNMGKEEQQLQLPLVPEHSWHLAIDTSLESPNDILTMPEQPAMAESSYHIQSHSIAVFESR